MAGAFAKNNPIYGATGVGYTLARAEFVADGTAFDSTHVTEWDFGDGGTASSNDTTHTWTAPAVYELGMTYLPDGAMNTVTVTRLVHIGVAMESLGSSNIERQFVLAKIPGPDLAGRLCFFLIPSNTGSSTPITPLIENEAAAFLAVTKAVHELFRDTILRMPGLTPELLTDGFYGIFPREAMYLGTTDQLLSRTAEMREILTKEYGAAISEAVPAGLYNLFFDIREDDDGNDSLTNLFRPVGVVLPQHNAASIENMIGEPGLDLTELDLAPSDLTLYFVRILIQEIAGIISDYVSEWITDPDEVMTVVILNTEDLTLSVRFLCRYYTSRTPPAEDVESIIWRQITTQWSVGEFDEDNPISTTQMYHDSREVGMNVLSNKEIDVLLEKNACLVKKAISLNNKIYEFDVAAGEARPYGDTSVGSDIQCYVATKGGGMVVLDTSSYGGSPFMGNMQLVEGMFNPTSEARNQFPGMAEAPAALVAADDLEEPSTQDVTYSSTQEGSVAIKEYKTVFDGGQSGASLVMIDPEEVGPLT